MGHFSGVVGAIVIGAHIGFAINELTNDAFTSYLLGAASFMFTSLLLTGLVHIRDAINKKG